MNVENIINNRDPYSLHPFAPEDEYIYEIEKIKKFIKKIKIQIN